MTQPKIERRRAPRASAQLPLRLSDDAGARAATLRNISASGLCCDFEQPLAEMTLLGIQLELPGGDGPHDVQGVVVRCDKRRGVAPPTYEVAVYFTEMPPATREAIHQFVAQTR